MKCYNNSKMQLIQLLHFVVPVNNQYKNKFYSTIDFITIKANSCKLTAI